MNTISVPLSVVNTFQPQVINGIAVDGIVDGRPVTIRRNRFNGVVPAIGSTFKSTYGTARVVGYVEGALKARIIDFDEDFEFETLDIENPDILTAEECVKGLSRCANGDIESLASDIRRLYTTLDGNVTKEGQRLIANLGSFAPNEYRCNLTDAYELLSAETEILVDYVHSFLVQKETPIERAERIKREQEQAKALADELLGADGSIENIPADVLAEMAMEFGEL
jgi:hypothetical protein